MDVQEHEELAGFSYDKAAGRHIITDAEMEADEDDRLESEQPWEAGYTEGEEWALEEQTKEATWDED